MINLLTGVVLDMYTLYYDDTDEESDTVSELYLLHYLKSVGLVQDVMGMYEQLTKRIETFTSNTTGRKFASDWVLIPRYTSAQMYAGSL